MVLPVPLAGALIGGLLGGSTSQQTTVTTTNSLQNAFNPVNNVNLGGGITASPYGGVAGDPQARASATTQQTQPSPSQFGFGLPVGGGVPGAAGLDVFGGERGAIAGAPAGGFISENLPLLLIGGGLAAFLLLKG